MPYGEVEGFSWVCNRDMSLEEAKYKVYRAFEHIVENVLETSSIWKCRVEHNATRGCVATQNLKKGTRTYRNIKAARDVSQSKAARGRDAI